MRTTGEAGQLFAGAVVELLPLITELSVARRNGPQSVNQQAGVDAETETKVRAAIVSAVTMQPELNAKVDLFSKLLFSVIVPFLSAAAPELESGN